MNDEKESTLKEHEKFWAFAMLVAAVIGLVLLAAFGLSSSAPNPATDVVYSAKLRIIDAAVAGLLTIAGMAAQALFRVSSIDKVNAQTALETARKVPEAPKPPQDVTVINPPEAPANVTETAPQEAPDDSLPEYAR